jgi:HK97 family phage major capsid protein
MSTMQVPEKLPPQYYSLELNAISDKIDKESRTVKGATFAAGSPVERWYGTVKLSMNPAHIRMGRMNNGLAVLYNHDDDQHIGITQNAKADGSKVSGDVRFGSNALASTKFQDVQDGILKYCSVGVIQHHLTLVETNNNGDNTYLCDDWEPFELSLTPIPAEGTRTPIITNSQTQEFPVVFDRRIATNSMHGDKNMATATTDLAALQTKVDQLSGALDARIAENAEIVTLCQSFGKPELASKFITEKLSLPAAKARLFDELQTVGRAQFSVRTSEGAAQPSDVQVLRDPEDKRGPGIALASIARSLAAAKGNKAEAAKFALNKFHDKTAYNALSASAATGGGFLVPEQLATEIIEFLRPIAIVRSLNPVLAPLPNGALSLPKITGTASAYYIGENQDITASAETLGQVKLTAKKLACVVPISNDLIRYASASADVMVREDMALNLAVAEDQAFLIGAGTNYSPRGIRNWALNANLIEANQTQSVQNTVTDLGKLIRQLREANVRFLRPGWVMSPRTEVYLMTLLTTTGNYIFRDEMLTGKLWGYPYKVTTLWPENLTENSVANSTEIMLADFADIVIGEVPTMVLEVSTEASYYNGSTLVSAFSQDQTVIKMIIEHDLAVRHLESIAVLTTVTWQ